MTERKEGKEPIEARLEQAEVLSEVLTVVNEIIMSEGYIATAKGAETIFLANRVGIRKFGRRAYFEAFQEKFGLAAFYMREPNDDE